jgi:hypothetical protein
LDIQPYWKTDQKLDHIAIDLGSRESQICVRNARGEILEEKRWATSKLRSYLEKRPPSRVIVETCAEAFRVANAARELGHDPRVVPATLAPALDRNDSDAARSSPARVGPDGVSRTTSSRSASPERSRIPCPICRARAAATATAMAPACASGWAWIGSADARA